MGKRIVWTELAKADIRSIDPPLFRLRSQNNRVFFRDKGEYLEIDRVKDRKDAYR